MRFLLLFVAALIAILAGIAALQLSAPKPEANRLSAANETAASSKISTIDVIVARQAIPAGTEITAAMIDKQPWPENLVLQGSLSGANSEKNGHR